MEWNKRFNLTAVTDPEEIRIRHFEDSLTVLQAIDLDEQSVVDVGAGAGFPGIPLKIVRPGIQLTLIEATRKKAEFLKHLVTVLGLTGVKVLWGRAEELVNYHGKYEVAVSRAVAKFPLLVKYCLPLLKIGGIFVALKQDAVEAEVKEANRNIEKLGGRLKEIKKVRVGELARSLVIIEKIK